MRRLGIASRRDDSAARLDDAIDALIDGRAALISAEESPAVELLGTARLLHESLPRFHPRFGFEERLARRLMGGEASVASSPGVVSLADRGGSLSADPLRPPVRRRGLVAGGAIASGLSLAIPLAGVALVAWRRSRPSGELT